MLARAYSMNFDVVLQILSLDSQKQRAEPLERSEISTHPEKVDFPQPCLFLWVVEPVPDAFEDAGKWRDADTRSNKDGHFVFEDVFGCGPKWTIDVDSG